MERRSVPELPHRPRRAGADSCLAQQLSQSPEGVVEDMFAHTEPGILVVAGMSAALALLQAQGHYTYFSA
jgi:hypothetical protein